MSNIQLVKAKQIANNLLKLSEAKLDLIQTPEVGEALTEKEMKVAQIGATIPIKSMNPEEAHKTLAAGCPALCKSVGIKVADVEQMIDEYGKPFAVLVCNHYGELTLAEVKYAFTISMTGDLDPFLKKGSDGKPDSNHYQSFSGEYVTRILNAYRQYKNGVWAKAYKALPEPDHEPTEEEKAEARAFIRGAIIEAYDEYRLEGTAPNFAASFTILQVFQRAGIISGMPEPTPDELVMGLAEAKRVANPYAKPGIVDGGSEQKVKAESLANNRAIRELFDKMIEGNYNMEDVI